MFTRQIILHKFQTEAARADVEKHVSKSQISVLLKEIKNTGEKLTLRDCTKLRESVGKLRSVLAEQNSKMQNKKAANLAKIDVHIGKIISNQLDTRSILKSVIPESSGTAKKQFYSLTRTNL